jgi:hypothetical protein
MKDATQIIIALALIVGGFALTSHLQSSPSSQIFSFTLPTQPSTTTYYTTEQTMRANLADLFMPLIMIGDPVGTCQLLGGHWFESPIKVGCYY